MSDTPGESFDVFLSHNTSDKPAVEQLARQLVAAGIRPWLDKWHLIPGQPWQQAIEDALRRCSACAVFIGPSGIGPWQNEEMRAAVDRRVTASNSRFPVVPVLLPGAKREERSRLPTFLVASTWVEFAQTLEDQPAFHRLTCGIRGVEPGDTVADDALSTESPYRGLLYFDIEHARFYFGREAVVDWLLHDLRPAVESRDRTRFLGIIGPSGSGKSSLARAGLLATLKSGGIRGSELWQYVVCRPGSDPLQNLAVALAGAAAPGQEMPAPGEFVRDSQQSERALHLFARSLFADAPLDRKLVVLVDQFEEAFTVCRDQKVRTAFIDNLIYACTVSGGSTVVMVTVRADFYGECSAHTTLAAALSEHQVLVGPMQSDQLRRAIERPAQLVGCEFEPGLVDDLLDDVADEPASLPLLEYTLSELWSRRQGRRLTHAAYKALGRLAGALEKRADQVYDELSEPEKAICRRMFMRLVQLSENGKLTKRRTRISELIPSEAAAPAYEDLIAKLAGENARLITVETATSLEQSATASPGRIVSGRVVTAAPAQYVDVAHEAVLRTWGRLQRWLDDDREFQLWQKRLRSEIDVWNRTRKDPESLLGGMLLEEALRWSGQRADELNDEERDYIAASDGYAKWLQQEERERQRQLQTEQEQRLKAETNRADAERQAARRASIAAILLAGLLVAVAGGSALYWTMAKTDRARSLAERARLARSAELALQAVSESRIPVTVQALYETSQKDVPALASELPVFDVAFEPSRNLLATAHAAGSAQLWKSAGTQAILWSAFNKDQAFAHGKSDVTSVAFHPRENLLATATGNVDATVRVWRPGSATPVWESPSQGDDDLNDVAFSRTGALVAAAARSGKLTVWNRESKAATSVQPAQNATTIAFSPTEDFLVAGFADGTVVRWKTGADSPGKAAGEDSRGKVHNLAFSPDGKRVAIASQHGVWIWDLEKPPVQVATRPNAVTRAVAYSPKGDLIAAADAEGWVSVLKADSLLEEARFTVPRIGALVALAFQPDPEAMGSSKLAVAGMDGVRIYELNVDLLVKALGVK